MINKSFDDYIASGDATTKALLQADSDLVKAIRTTHDFFAKELWAQGGGMSPIAMMAAMNAFMLYLAGVRVAMTGHAAAIFPLLRTALESACYAFLMSRNPDLERVWLDRHRDKAGLAACRKSFTSAVKDTAKGINAIQADSGDIVLQAYEAAIDFGGHPNVRSVFGHVSVNDPGGDEYHVNLAGLYGPEAREISQALVACLDFGQAIAIVLLRSLKDPTEDQGRALDALNDGKEAAVASLGGR